MKQNDLFKALEEAKLIITEVVTLNERHRRLLEIINGTRSIDEL